MALDLGAWETQSEEWSPGATLPAELPALPLSNGQPANVVDVPRSEGITLGGVLNGFSATAESALQFFGKTYQLQSNIENARFARTVNAATLDLQRAQALGTLDVQRATIDANIAIEKARAARATGDALAQINSGRAGFYGGRGISPLLLIAGLVGLFVFVKRGKA